MQRFGSAFGVAAASASGVAIAAGTAAATAPPTPLEPWRHCWTSRAVADVCCNGAWGGTGCWEEHRSFDVCCLPAAPWIARAARGSQRRRQPCSSRLARVAAAISTDAVRERLVTPVQEQVVRHHQLLTNSTSSGRRSLLPFLAGPSALERKALLELTSLVTAELEQRGITFWAHGTTLLGALQHYGPIPWEDQVELAAFAGSVEDVLAALKGAAGTKAASAFGPVVVKPTMAPACRETCGHWIVSFANGLAFQGGSGGQRAPSLQVGWLDPRGESPAWTGYYNLSPPGTHARFTHYDVLSLTLPVVRGRPFAHLRLPIPRHSWRLLEQAAEMKNELPLQACRLRATGGDAWRGTASQHMVGNVGMSAGFETTLPCATLTSVFPMVTSWRNFESRSALLAELGTASSRRSLTPSGQSDGTSRQHLSRAKLAAEGGSGGKLAFSVEVAVDAMRGTHVLLVGHEQGGAGAGMCWRRIYGEHDLITGAADQSPSSLPAL